MNTIAIAVIAYASIFGLALIARALIGTHRHATDCDCFSCYDAIYGEIR